MNRDSYSNIIEMHTHIRKEMQCLTDILTCRIKKQIYRKINPIFFDVSLRDGIQSANPEYYPTSVKRNIFHQIFSQYNPKNIEVGSMVSPKVLPIMSDTVSLHEYIRCFIDDRVSNMCPYILIPNNQYLQTAVSNGMRNFSFITSVSNAFQLKNTRKTIQETKTELKAIEETLNCYQSTRNRKLYISCINECPLTGKIDNDLIVSEILHYHTNYEFSELCLSDTMGTLRYDDFEYIVDTIRYFGLPNYKISLHLHMSESNREEIQEILFYCFNHGINRFDASLLTEGGCSVTMGKSALPNLTYDRFFELIHKYIERKIT